MMPYSSNNRQSVNKLLDSSVLCDVMKLKLSVSKKYASRLSEYTEEIVFTVIDLDKAGSYPSNFVCILPKKLERECKPTNKFLKIYGKESRAIANRLLTNALRSENDLAVKSEIEKRLKALKPEATIRANCVSCGCIFEPKKHGRFLQRMCDTCRSKNRSSAS